MSTVKYIHACGASSVTHQCLKSIGCLQELQHAMDELHAFGVAFASCYGEGSAASTSYSNNSYPTPALISMAEYVGHETYHPIWDELNKRKTIVFLHGAQVPSSTPYPHDFLGVPITEVSTSHNRTICDLIMTGTKRDIQSSRTPGRNRAPTTFPRCQNHFGTPRRNRSFPRSTRRGPLQPYGLHAYPRGNISRLQNILLRNSVELLRDESPHGGQLRATRPYSIWI